MHCMTPLFCVQPSEALTVTQSQSSYPLHFLLAADAIVVAESGVRL